ncbi:hypothetical protein QQF64_008917 [Cirrhinus molitorella]|uniref:G-protein coupled receptors family 1 profile domain-containing protein n=1 Tax=Cirrhinus molitorella TaxID=172907 RepID=A0ABR3M8B4_9TELE
MPGLDLTKTFNQVIRTRPVSNQTTVQPRQASSTNTAKMKNNSSGHENFTGPQLDPMQTVLSGSEIFSIMIYFVVFALGTVGKGLIIYVTGYKMKTTVNSIWFLNLTIADFIFILIIILYIVNAFNKVWLFGDFMCKFVSFVTVLHMFASIFLLTAISLDQCLSTWVIVWAQNKRTLVRIICILMWVFSIGCSIPFVMHRSGENHHCAYVCPYDIIKSLFIYRFIVGFLIPFLIIASSYIAIECGPNVSKEERNGLDLTKTFNQVIRTRPVSNQTTVQPRQASSTNTAKMTNNSSGHENFTDQQLNNPMQTVLSGSEIFSIIIYFVVFALGTVGNGLVIYVTGYKMKTTVNSIWFLNLAIADFIFILIIILYIVNAFNKVWLFGDFMCKFVSFVTVLNMFAGIFLLTAISLDRCLSTWVIVWAQNKQTLVKARIICILMWVFSIGCSIPFVMHRSGENRHCAYVCPYDIIKSLFIYRFMVGFLIPFLIIASSYIAIRVQAKRLKRGKKPFPVIIFVMLAFFFCWFPFHVQQLSYIIAMDNKWMSFLEVLIKIGPFVNCLVHLNSCLNPILYVFMCKEFRKKLKQSLLVDKDQTRFQSARSTAQTSASSTNKAKMNLTAAPTPNSKNATAEYLKHINVFLHCIICVLGVVGNGMVIYIAGLKMKRTVNAIWFLNLAVADFLFSFFLIFNIVYEYRDFDWPFGDFMCMLSSLVITLNSFASTFLLTAISLDRCLSTWVVVWARTKRTILKVRIICLLIWLAAVACSLPLVIYRKTHYISPEQTWCIPGFSDMEAYKRSLVFRFVVGFLIPFIIILASYVAIGVRVKRLQKKNKLKPFRIILAVILAFFFCWLPFYVYRFLEIWLYEKSKKNPSDELTKFIDVFNQIGLFILSLAYLNSCLNPFLYVFMCEKFQKKLRQSLVMVFESAFAEENLSFFSQHSQSQRKSQSRTGPCLTQSLTLEG